jgi:hypothetical protein
MFTTGRIKGDTDDPKAKGIFGLWFETPANTGPGNPFALRIISSIIGLTFWGKNW